MPKKKVKKKNWIQIITSAECVSGLQALLSLVLLFFIYKLNVLPIHFFGIVALILALFWVGLFLMQKPASKKKKSHLPMAGKVISLLLSVVLALGCVYLIKGSNVLGIISGSKEEIYTTSVVVLHNHEAERLKDLEGKNVGYLSNSSTQDTQNTLTAIKDKEKVNISAVSYQDIMSLSEALYSGHVDAIILEDINRPQVEIFHDNFENETRIIYQYERTEKVDVIDLNTNVLKDTFTIFVSGIDTYGAVSTVSRSDVNLLVTVNPKTHQVLITSIPRDYYVKLARNGQYDKLTHAGIYGVSESINTLANLFDIDIDFYARVNFTGLINIVDALGGVNVNSPYAFTTRHGKYPIVKGDNYLDGEKALGFVRERYALPNGDYDRGQNQQRLLTAMMKKMLSPTIITNYSSIMDAIGGSFETSMDSSDITSLIQNQLSSNPNWQFMSYQVKGTGGSDVTYSMPGYHVYVTYPNYDTVQEVTNMIQAMEEGQVVSLPQ